jgi:nucleoside-diphosphate-sugar epimerase
MQILITGAAGLIGAELAYRLAANGHAVTALVHRTSLPISPACPSRHEGPGPGPGEIVTRSGDVRIPGFGLSTRPAFDLLVHAAAVTAFDAPDTAYQAINIEGTSNAVALARASRASLLHISTAYVCGTLDGSVSPGAIGPAFTNGYEASKAAAEAIVRASGLPHAIARPSVVVGEWAEGRISRFENIYMIFKLIAEGRIRTLPAAPGATLDLVPLDHVTSGLLTIAAHLEAFAGQTVHLVAQTPTPIPAIGAAMARARLGTPQFVAPAAFDLTTLPARETRWHAAAASLYTAYLQRSPRFQADHPLITTCPPTDAAWLDRLISFAVAADFVRPQRTSG